MLNHLANQPLQSTISSENTKYLPKRTNEGNCMSDDMSNIAGSQVYPVSHAENINDSSKA